jgi:drug/metabolite transporter (DMT)-like permease
MHWISIALLAPAFWAMGNHIDKYLLGRRFDQRGVGSLMIFSALIGLPMMPLILLIRPGVFQISLLDGAIMMLNGMLYVVGLLPYFYALQKDEASIVVPLFQITAVFSYMLGLLVLGEELTGYQIGAALLIVVGSIMITLEIDRRRSKFKAKVFALMLLAALLNALNWLLFKVVAIREDFWASSFWEYAGFALAGVMMLLFVKSYRTEFLEGLRQSKLNVLGLVALNETLSLAAKTATNVASLLAPLALISTLHGLQPLFVFIYGVLLTLYLPRYGRERLGAAIVFQKVAAIALMIVGTSLLTLS